MIEKISRGFQIGGLIRYLMGPGRFNEHTEQRVVATWDNAPQMHQVPELDGGGFDVTELVDRLLEPARAGRVSLSKPVVQRGARPVQGPVWHCSLRNHVEDRVLSDSEWAEVVADVLDSTGIAPRGDQGACRWVAIRHADDHVHIAAMLVRQDTGRRFFPYRDWPNTRKVCQAAEVRLGITRTEKADRTAVRQSSRAELEKAARRGLEETSREWLRRIARVAAVQARDAEGFRRAVRDLGALYQSRVSASGEVLGYSLAAVGDVNAAGLPIWYSGSRLASDLSMPKLAARWASAPAPTAPIPPAAGERSRVGRQERAAAVVEATSAIEHATAAVAAGELDEAPGIAHAASDMLNAVEAVTGRARPPAAGGPADIYQRASLSPGVGQPTRWGPVAAQLRSAAWRLMAVRALVGAGGRDAGVGQLVLALATLIAEIGAYHEQRQCLAHARAARASRDLLTGRPPGHPNQPSGPRADTGREQSRAATSTRAPRPPGASRPVVKGTRPTGNRRRGPRI